MFHTWSGHYMCGPRKKSYCCYAHSLYSYFLSLFSTLALLLHSIVHTKTSLISNVTFGECAWSNFYDSSELGVHAASPETPDMHYYLYDLLVVSLPHKDPVWEGRSWSRAGGSKAYRESLMCYVYAHTEYCMPTVLVPWFQCWIGTCFLEGMKLGCMLQVIGKTADAGFFEVIKRNQGRAEVYSVILDPYTRAL